MNDTSTDKQEKKNNLILRKHHSSDQCLQESTHSENDSYICESAGVHNWIFDYIKYNILIFNNSIKHTKLTPNFLYLTQLHLILYAKNLKRAERVRLKTKTKFYTKLMIL